MAVNDDNRPDPNGDADAGLTRIYGETGREEPPARLDAAILAAARREVGARPRPLAALRAWRMPVGIAAVVVLSVSLVMLVRKEGGDELYPSAPRDLPRPVEPVPPTSEAPAQKPPARRALEMGPGEPPAARPRPQPFPEADVARREAAPRAPAAVMDSRAPSATPAPGAGAGGGPAAEAREAAPPPAVAPAAKAMREEQHATAKEDSGPAAAGRDVASERQRPEVAMPSERLYSRQRAMGSLSGQQPRVAALLKELDPQPPEKWLESIRALRREGHSAEANEVLAEFKRRYPAYPLPAGVE